MYVLVIGVVKFSLEFQSFVDLNSDLEFMLTVFNIVVVILSKLNENLTSQIACTNRLNCIKRTPTPVAVLLTYHNMHCKHDQYDM